MDIRMVTTRMEPGLILGDRVFSYVEVADVLVREEPPLRLRLKMEDFGAFLEYARSRIPFNPLSAFPSTLWYW